MRHAQARLSWPDTGMGGLDVKCGHFTLLPGSIDSIQAGNGGGRGGLNGALLLFNFRGSRREGGLVTRREARGRDERTMRAMGSRYREEEDWQGGRDRKRRRETVRVMKRGVDTAKWLELTQFRWCPPG
jgi:hypothetical protein